MKVATLTRDVGAPLREVIRSFPDDASLSTQSWAQLTSGWKANLEQMQSLSRQLTPGSTFSATTFSATLTTSLTLSLSLPFDSAAIDTAPVAHLKNMLYRPTLFREALDALYAFGLDQGQKGSRSPTELLEEAHTELTQPSGLLPSPASVLIPARESLDHALAILLQRRPQQEPTTSGKVLSIGSQCGLSGLDADHFTRLGTDLATLSGRLSGSKQSAMARSEISNLFNQVLQFHKALLESLDRTKLRS